MTIIGSLIYAKVFIKNNNALKKRLCMGNRQMIWVLMLFIPVFAFGQASGGQIKRPQKKTQQATIERKRPAEEQQIKKKAQPAKGSTVMVQKSLPPKYLRLSDNSFLCGELLLTKQLGVRQKLWDMLYDQWKMEGKLLYPKKV